MTRLRARLLALTTAGLLASTASAQVELFGDDCAGGSAVPPTIAVSGVACTSCAFDIEVTGPPTAVGTLLVGNSDSLWMGLNLPFDLTLSGLPGCPLNVGPIFTFPLVMDVTGTASFPVTGWTACLELYFQAFVFDPGPATFGGMTTGMQIAPVCDDGDPCTVDFCVAGTCINQPLDCNDGSACTIDLGCVNGECQYVALNCDDGNPCTIDDCDPVVGCFNQTIPDTCAIAGVCYAAGEANPANPCEVCDPDFSTFQWKPCP